MTNIPPLFGRIEPNDDFIILYREVGTSNTFETVVFEEIDPLLSSRRIGDNNQGTRTELPQNLSTNYFRFNYLIIEGRLILVFTYRNEIYYILNDGGNITNTRDHYFDFIIDEKPDVDLFYLYSGARYIVSPGYSAATTQQRDVFSTIQFEMVFLTIEHYSYDSLINFFNNNNRNDFFNPVLSGKCSGSGGWLDPIEDDGCVFKGEPPNDLNDIFFPVYSNEPFSCGVNNNFGTCENQNLCTFNPNILFPNNPYVCTVEPPEEENSNDIQEDEVIVNNDIENNIPPQVISQENVFSNIFLIVIVIVIIIIILVVVFIIYRSMKKKT
ncbi:MAG: hypothetical protein WBA74_12465 [Cyclobacteriaceae bacterium]